MHVLHGKYRCPFFPKLKVLFLYTIINVAIYTHTHTCTHAHARAHTPGMNFKIKISFFSLCRFVHVDCISSFLLHGVSTSLHPPRLLVERTPLLGTVLGERCQHPPNKHAERRDAAVGERDIGKDLLVCSSLKSKLESAFTCRHSSCVDFDHVPLIMLYCTNLYSNEIFQAFLYNYTYSNGSISHAFLYNYTHSKICVGYNYLG